MIGACRDSIQHLGALHTLQEFRNAHPALLTRQNSAGWVEQENAPSIRPHCIALHLDHRRVAATSRPAASAIMGLKVGFARDRRPAGHTNCEASLRHQCRRPAARPPVAGSTGGAHATAAAASEPPLAPHSCWQPPPRRPAPCLAPNPTTQSKLVPPPPWLRPFRRTLRRLPRRPRPCPAASLMRTSWRCEWCRGQAFFLSKIS